MHQVDVKYNRHTRNVGIWNNLSKPGERLGMAQEFELAIAMFDLMQMVKRISYMYLLHLS